jgi:diaminopropionate ammonia-lyase
MHLLINPNAQRVVTCPHSHADPPARPFHRTMPGYEPSKLVAARSLAADLGLLDLQIKDESRRFGLPSFKVLGASWAVARSLCRHIGVPDLKSFAELQDALRGDGALTLTCASDGNHGRAVAMLARRLGLRARIFVPDAVSAARAKAIAGEGAEVVVLPVDYDEAVTMAAATADERTLVVSDTSWPGYEDVPRWVVDGYSTILEEVDEDLAHRSDGGPDVVVVQMGVGAFAAAVIRHFKAPGRKAPARVLGVEPHDAACVMRSLAADEIVAVRGPHLTSMDGLNCGTPSQVAWPLLRAGLDAVVAVRQEDSNDAMRNLASCGIEAGESGAAGLAGLRVVARATDGSVRDALGLTGRARVLIFNTEGATDASSYRNVVDR